MTSNSERTKRKLQRNYEEIEKHLNQGRERIVGSYIEDYKVGQTKNQEHGINVDEVNRLIEEYDDHPPHQSIIQNAILLIEEALDRYEGWERTTFGEEPSLQPDLYYILISIGTEYLLNGIVLKKDPEFFENVTEMGYPRSPGFSDLIEWLTDEQLSDDLDQDQRDLIGDVLNLVRLQRNNFVHLGYHHHTHSKHPGLIHYILQYLVREFLDDDSITHRLSEYASFDHSEYVEMADYKPLPT